MKLTNTQLTVIAAVAAFGIYLYTKDKSALTQYQNAYNTLADQLTSGKLVSSDAVASGTAMTATK